MCDIIILEFSTTGFLHSTHDYFFHKVFNITKDNLRNFAEVETFFLSLRKALGIRMHADRLKKYEEKRKQTVKEIFLTKRRMY